MSQALLPVFQELKGKDIEVNVTFRVAHASLEGRITGVDNPSGNIIMEEAFDHLGHMRRRTFNIADVLYVSAKIHKTA